MLAVLLRRSRPLLVSDIARDFNFQQLDRTASVYLNLSLRSGCLRWPQGEQVGRTNLLMRSPFLRSFSFFFASSSDGLHPPTASIVVAMASTLLAMASNRANRWDERIHRSPFQPSITNWASHCWPLAGRMKQRWPSKVLGTDGRMR